MTQKDWTNQSYRRSDHKSFREKKHNMVIDAQGASNKIIPTESGNLKFENGVAVLPNDERAKDIVDELNGSPDPNVRALHPEQYALVENKPTVNVDPIHRYTFGSHPPMPWASYDERGRRVKDTETEEETQDDGEQDRRIDRTESDAECCAGDVLA